MSSKFMIRTFAALATVCLFLSPAHAAPPLPLPAIETVEVGPQGQFIVNGEVFLPIMSWAQHPSNSWNSFANLRGLNFNTFMGNQSTVTPLQQAVAAQAVGGYAVVQQRQADEVAAAAGHVHILGWHHRDEPDMPQASEDGYVPRTPPEVIAANYQFLQSQNINRPVFVTFTGHFMEEFRSNYTAQQQAEIYPAYVAEANVIGYDLYPIYGYGRANWLNRVASGVAQLVALADGRPVYAWIETSKGSQWMTYEKQPDVLPIHTRYQVWGSLIQGATAIGYFTHAWRPVFTEFAPTPEMQDELRRLNGQITRLAPAILAAPSEREISIVMTAAGTGVTLTSHFKATEYDGRLWIFAQNTDLGHNAHLLRQFDPISPRAGNARINVEGLAAGTPIRRLTDDADTLLITAEDGYFEDSFDPLGERIYVVMPPTDEPVNAVYQIAASADDMDCNQWNSSLATAYIHVPYGSDDRRAFLRWQIDVPAGAVINSAYLAIKSQTGYSGAGSVRLQMIDSDDCPPFDSSVPYGWAVNAGQVDWVLEPWVSRMWHISPDMTGLVQAIVNRAGYAPGNYVGLRIAHVSGGLRRALSYDNSPNDGAYLVINYNPLPEIYWTTDSLAPGATVLTDGFTVSRLGGLNEVTVSFKQQLDAATVVPGCVTVVGQFGGDVSSRISGFSLLEDGRKLRILFQQGLPDADRYTISLTDVLRTSEGTIPDGKRDLTIALLAGDVDGSGKVTAADVMAVRQATGRTGNDYLAAFDVNGSGTITGADMRAVRSRVGRQLGDLAD